MGFMLEKTGLKQGYLSSLDRGLQIGAKLESLEFGYRIKVGRRSLGDVPTDAGYIIATSMANGLPVRVKACEVVRTMACVADYRMSVMDMMFGDSEDSDKEMFGVKVVIEIGDECA